MNSSRLIESKLLSSYTLLTGASGLVGNYLLRDLLMRGRKVAVVVRAKKNLTAEQRVEIILQRWESELGHPLPRPIVFSGDIAETNLGISQTEINWIQNHCDQMIHNAAVLQFHGQGMDQEPWRTNLGGTKNAIDLARRTGVSDFNYVSTAYVCGVRDETVYEDELECGQSFRNDYERSKFRSELLVHAADGFKAKTIFRPAVIVGDSQTGFTTTYHGIYLYLRLLAMLVPEQRRDDSGKFVTPIQLPFSGDEPRNLVPVDWVSAVIAHVVSTPAAKNRTYHLVPDRCATARDVIEACYEYFNSAGVVYCGQQQERIADNEFAERFFENAKIYEAYETSDPRFDNRNLKKFAGQLPCPPVDRQMIIRFMEFGVADNWGKRKSKSPQVASWFSSQLDDVISGARSLDWGRFLPEGQRILKVGFDVHGPGGSQWQLVASRNDCEMVPGLPENAHRTLRLGTEQILATNGSAPAFWANRISELFKEA